MNKNPARVIPLLEGYIVRLGKVIVDASSSVTLVESAGQRLIVDTGSPRNCTAMRTALRQIRVPVTSIKHVVNTHMHIDHFGCNHVFKSARVYAHVFELPPIGTVRIRDSLTVLPGVEIVPTPGHTYGSVSVLVKGDRRYAMCGDAIPTRENYLKHVPPAINVDPRLALKSMDAIVESADVIIPGHGPPFDVSRKK